MLTLLLLLFATLCQAEDFSSRPNSASLKVLHSTQIVLDSPVVMGMFSIWSLMTILSICSSGDTSNEISSAFLIPKNKSQFKEEYVNLSNTVFNVDREDISVSNRNYLFVDKDSVSLNSVFKNMMTKDYKLEFKSLNFKDTVEAAKTANSVVASSSLLGKGVFDSKDFENTSMVMSNIFLFEGYWSNPFSDNDYTKESLLTSDNKIVDVYMLKKTMRVPHSHMDDVKATITELSFGNDGTYSLLLITPDTDVSTNQVYKNIEKVSLKTVLDKLHSDVLESGLRQVDVKVPLLIKASLINLKGPLNYMGVHEALDANFARFQPMVEDHMYVGDIQYDTCVLMLKDEVMVFASTPGIKEFKTTIDVPALMPRFIFFIVEKTTSTILVGGLFP